MTRKNGEFCNHFTGLVGHSACRAGVAYDDVKEPGDGHGVMLPCIQGYEGTIVCPKRELPTAEQIAQRDAEVADWLHRLAAATRGELKECLECRAPVERYVEVRPCVYAEPCGHRQWQGRAPK